MQTIWHIKGAKAGTFEQVDDDAAAKLTKNGRAQIADGATPLEYPENHPHYKPRKRTTYKTKVAEAE